MWLKNASVPQSGVGLQPQCQNGEAMMATLVSHIYILLQKAGSVATMSGNRFFNAKPSHATFVVWASVLSWWSSQKHYVQATCHSIFKRIRRTASEGELTVRQNTLSYRWFFFL